MNLSEEIKKLLNFCDLTGSSSLRTVKVVEAIKDPVERMAKENYSFTVEPDLYKIDAFFCKKCPR